MQHKKVIGPHGMLEVAAMKESEIRNQSNVLVHAVHVREADRLELPFQW